MRGRLTFVLLFSAAVALAQNDISDAKDVTIEVVLTGTESLPTPVRDAIITEVKSQGIDAAQIYTHEFEERLRDAFQKRGYFKAEIQDAEWGPVTGTGRHRHTTVTVQVHEGNIYRTGSIVFNGATVFDSVTLRASIPQAEGEIFNVEHMRTGLKNLDDMYCSKGYIDFTPVPNTEIKEEDRTVNILFDLDEGKQYRVGQLFLQGQEPYPGAGKALLEGWKIHMGEVYDCHIWMKVWIEYNKRHGSKPEAFSEDGLPVRVNRETKTVDLIFEFPDPK
jgi:hypothetical protein